MLWLRRTSSASSCLSNITSSESSLTNPTNSVYIHHRRQFSPSRQQALECVFLAKSHPSRDERRALANELCMELKYVTIWFQNKRKMTKKNARKENALAKRHMLHHESFRSISSHPSSTLQPRRTMISLDDIAKLSERPSGCLATRPHLHPHTPRIANMRKPFSCNIDKSELWERMPSSPIASLGSPEADRARLSFLPERSKTMRSLEWACVKARSSTKRDTDCVHELGLDLSDLHEGGDSSDTDVEMEEAVTPDASINLSPDISTPWSKGCTTSLETWSGSQNSEDVAFEDVEAAMLLLGFMGRR